MGGVISPFGNPALPTGAAGGDLSGTYPNPGVAQSSASPFLVKNAALATPATTGGMAYSVNVLGTDTFDRWRVVGDGTTSWGPGTGARDTTLARSAAGVLSVTVGSFSVTTAGQGLAVKEGTNAKQGTAVLAAGTVVVANTSVTANSRILLTCQSLGTVSAPSALCVSARTAGTSFTILASQATDTSTIAYQIFEPA